MSSPTPTPASWPTESHPFSTDTMAATTDEETRIALERVIRSAVERKLGRRLPPPSPAGERVTDEAPDQTASFAPPDVAIAEPEPRAPVLPPDVPELPDPIAPVGDALYGDSELLLTPLGDPNAFPSPPAEPDAPDAGPGARWWEDSPGAEVDPDGPSPEEAAWASPEASGASLEFFDAMEPLTGLDQPRDRLPARPLPEPAGWVSPAPPPGPTTRPSVAPRPGESVAGPAPVDHEASAPGPVAGEGPAPDEAEPGAPGAPELARFFVPAPPEPEPAPVAGGTPAEPGTRIEPETQAVPLSEKSRRLVGDFGLRGCQHGDAMAAGRKSEQQETRRLFSESRRELLSHVARLEAEIARLKRALAGPESVAPDHDPPASGKGH